MICGEVEEPVQLVPGHVNSGAAALASATLLPCCGFDNTNVLTNIILILNTSHLPCSFRKQDTDVTDIDLTDNGA